MDKRKKHIQNLVYFALADNNFDIAEKDFIKQVGKRLNIDENELNILLESKVIEQPEIPEDEVQRYILFDDILNLIVIDKKIEEQEESEIKKIAGKLGFPSNMVDDIIVKLKRHIELGFDANQISHSIKNSVFSLTNKNKLSHGKYSL